MKILQVISYFNPKFGGDVNIVTNLSKQLAKKGHEVTILTTDYQIDKKYTKVINNERVKVVPFHCKFNIGLFIYTPSMKRWVKENIKQFDIVHMHNFRSYQNNIIYHYTQKYNVLYILQAHGSVLPFFSKIRLKKMYDLIWGYKILKGASKVIALTTIELNNYKKIGVEVNKIEIVPNGIDLQAYENLPNQGSFRKKYEISENEKIILYLGRIHKIKGIDLLIDAFCEVQKEIPMSKLLIVGPDEGCLNSLQIQAMTSNVGNNILFTGPLYGEDKLAAYIDANVYVLPSIYEAFPITVLEAWACGTPVIMTKGCCISDIVENIGYSVSYDKDEVKSAINNILNDDTIRVKFGKIGKELVAEKFDLNKIINKVEKIYNDCIKS